MTEIDYRDHYIQNTPETRCHHGLDAQRAIWPAIESIARARSCWGSPAVIEGRAILPDLFFGGPARRGCLLGFCHVQPLRLRPQNGINGTTTVRRTITARKTVVNARSMETDPNRAGFSTRRTGPITGSVMPWVIRRAWESPLLPPTGDSTPIQSTTMRAMSTSSNSKRTIPSKPA